MTQARTDFDVAVVGYGPVGAFAALLLAEEGLRVAILERSRDVVVLPRAVGLDGESVRAFQRIGLGDAVAAILQPPRERDEVCFTDSKRRRLFGMEIPPQGPMGWRDVSFFDQPELEALLKWRSNGAHLSNYGAALLAKKQWLMANDPTRARQLRHVLYAKDLLVFRLTG